MKMALFELVLLLFLSASTATEYHVVSSDGTPCLVDGGCHNISYYLSHYDEYLTSNTVLTFLNGTHLIEQNKVITVTGVNNLTFQGLGEMEPVFNTSVKQSTVKIECSSNAKLLLIFTNSYDIQFSKITFDDCGLQIRKGKLYDHIVYSYNNRNILIYNWDFSVGFKASHTLLFINGSNVGLHNVSVDRGTGYGISLVNVFNINISHCYLTNNNNNKQCSDRNNNSDIKESCRGGNLLITYLESTQCPITEGNSLVSIIDTSLLSGHNLGKPSSHYKFHVSYLWAGVGGGLSIVAGDYYMCGHYQIYINGLTAEDNVGYMGDNIGIQGLPISLNINNLQSSSAYLGMYISVSLEPPEGVEWNFTLTNSIFKSSGMYMQIRTSKSWSSINMESCTFRDMTQFPFFAMLIDIQGAFVQDVEMSIHNTTIRNIYNKSLNELSLVSTYISAVQLHNVNCSMSDVTIVDNTITGLLLSSSTVYFNGDNTISNNSSPSNGGGLYLADLSYFVLSEGSFLHISNNSAVEYGGAIYIPSNTLLYQSVACFFQIYDPSHSQHPNITIEAINNTANITGTFLSGGEINICEFTEDSYYKYCNLDESGYTCALDILTEWLLQPKYNDSDHYFISSKPIGVTVCNSTNVNIARHSTQHIYPGESFTLNIATVGDNIGISPGIVLAYLVDGCYSTQYITDVTKALITNRTLDKCTNLPFFVPQQNGSRTATLQIRPQTSVFYWWYLTVCVDIHYKKCPLWFDINELGRCDCNQYLAALNDQDNVTVSCNISTNTISRSGNVWIGYECSNGTGHCTNLTGDNITTHTLISDDCPYDYCKRDPVTFSSSHVDHQCTGNRGGILCGSCTNGHSITLGSNKCSKNCTDDGYIALVVVFAVAGIGLVVLLIALNLTVSVGTINGLIFYANIVKLNEASFFPYGSVPVLSLFISWLNLDFGIETCFFNGLTPVIKVWLQIVFPIYIGVIIIIIIIVSHFSEKVAKLMGNNTVPVLLTLLLLSYMKIIRWLVQALSNSKITSDDSSYSVWRVDGNINYSTGQHLPLFIAALVVAVVLVLPYTLFLILLQLMMVVLSSCGRIWLMFFKPLCDSYAGPHCNHCRFWIGLLILARIIIAVFIAWKSEEVGVFVIMFVVIFLLTIALDIDGPYKKQSLNILESWFLANLLCISVVALARDSRLTYIGTMISVSLVFATFVGIIIVHVLMRFKGYLYPRYRLYKYITDKLEASGDGSTRKNLTYEPINNARNTNSSRSSNGRRSRGVAAVGGEKLSSVNQYNRYQDSILDLLDDED